jgi:hypothetical protein
MHALMPTVLLQLTGLDAFDGDAQTQPPDREFGKVEQRVGGGSKCGIAKWLVNEGELTSEDKKSNLSPQSAALFMISAPSVRSCWQGRNRGIVQANLDLPDSFPSNEQCQKDFENWKGNAQTIRLISRWVLIHPACAAQQRGPAEIFLQDLRRVMKLL